MLRKINRSIRRPSRGKTQPTRGLMTIALATAVSCGGCCLPDMIRATIEPYETVKEVNALEHRARHYGRKVWKQKYAASFASSACIEEIRKGFLEGYAETAIGFKGCPPPIPNRPLVSADYVTHTYPAAVPWYQGYNIGHASAVAHGVDRWRLAPLNPDLVANCSCETTNPYALPAGAVPNETMQYEAMPTTPSNAEPVPEGVPIPEPTPELDPPAELNSAPLPDVELPEVELPNVQSVPDAATVKPSKASVKVATTQPADEAPVLKQPDSSAIKDFGAPLPVKVETPSWVKDHVPTEYR